MVNLALANSEKQKNQNTKLAALECPLMENRSIKDNFESFETFQPMMSNLPRIETDTLSPGMVIIPRSEILYRVQRCTANMSFKYLDPGKAREPSIEVSI